MTEFPRWQDVRSGIVAGVGGKEGITEARNRNQSYIDGHRLAERRKALGLTQAQAAERMGVPKSRVSQIERGEVSTIDAVARYVQAIGGIIMISAVFGDDHYILRGPPPKPPDHTITRLKRTATPAARTRVRLPCSSGACAVSRPHHTPAAASQPTYSYQGLTS
jgi:transcriptional regulator with XRE-family HTH domain